MLQRRREQRRWQSCMEFANVAHLDGTMVTYRHPKWVPRLHVGAVVAVARIHNGPITRGFKRVWAVEYPVRRHDIHDQRERELLDRLYQGDYPLCKVVLVDEPGLGPDHPDLLDWRRNPPAVDPPHTPA